MHFCIQRLKRKLATLLIGGRIELFKIVDMDAIREKLKKLKEQRKQASQANFKEVLEENERSKRPANWDKRLERNLKKVKEEEERQKAEEAGKDFETIKNLDYQADEIERWEKFKGNKKRQSNDFVDYEESTKRQYNRLVKQIKPDLEDYKALKDQIGEGKFYPDESADTSKADLIKDSKEGVDRMAEDVQKQIEARGKKSRRRRHDDDADIDYINERNMKFNKKLERFYGEYTEEIKQNFERGTAI